MSDDGGLRLASPLTARSYEIEVPLNSSGLMPV
jgi:hypothetical protein